MYKDDLEAAMSRARAAEAELNRMKEKKPIRQRRRLRLIYDKLKYYQGDIFSALAIIVGVGGVVYGITQAVSCGIHRSDVWDATCWKECKALGKIEGQKYMTVDVRRAQSYSHKCECIPRIGTSKIIRLDDKDYDRTEKEMEYKKREERARKNGTRLWYNGQRYIEKKEDIALIDIDFEKWKIWIGECLKVCGDLSPDFGVKVGKTYNTTQECECMMPTGQIQIVKLNKGKK